MTEAKWQELKAKIQGAFKEVEMGQEALIEPERGDLEFVEFDGPTGRMRLELVVRPIVIGKQVQGARRIGAHHEVELLYSDSETSRTLRAYNWNDAEGAWQEIDWRGNFSG